ncbi:MAG: hypothetical protein ACR2F8_02960 [Caulobacteraceae bacterium]
MTPLTGAQAIYLKDVCDHGPLAPCGDGWAAVHGARIYKATGIALRRRGPVDFDIYDKASPLAATLHGRIVRKSLP